jgi:hypothetical protein
MGNILSKKLRKISQPPVALMGGGDQRLWRYAIGDVGMSGNLAMGAKWLVQ